MPSLSTRVIELEKEAGTRCGIGLAQHSKGVAECQYIEESSVLSGHVLPGDLITAANGLEATSASRLAKECRDAEKLVLHVHTPHPSGQTVCFVKEAEVGFTLTRSSTGLACVGEIKVAEAPSSTHDIESGGMLRPALPLSRGDTILAVKVGGVSYSVDSPREAQARLREVATGALVELRVLRAAAHGAASSASDMAASATSTRTSAIRKVEPPKMGGTLGSRFRGERATEGCSTPTESSMMDSDVDSSTAEQRAQITAEQMDAVAEHVRAMRRPSKDAGRSGGRPRWWPAAVWWSALQRSASSAAPHLEKVPTPSFIAPLGDGTRV